MFEEWQVLEAILPWLVERGAIISQVSVAQNQSISVADQRDRVKRLLRELGHADVNFVSSGPDIVAAESGVTWKIECKGQKTSRKQETILNNFQRALASTVSYYTADDGTVRLGLAVPSYEAYLILLAQRVPAALQNRLDLRILLVDPETSTVLPWLEEEPQN